MPELHLPEDEALQYVLGELTAAERVQFEARLAQSAELRAMVRELEEGAVALALASPRRRPPPENWMQIQKRVAGDRRWKWSALWTSFWRPGWAVAIVCFAGWLWYAMWINRPGAAGVRPTPVTVQVTPQHRVEAAELPTEKTAHASPQIVASNASFQLLQARTQEINSLRWQMVELTNRLKELSETVAHKEALLSEPGRVKFFQLTSPAGRRGSGSAPVSPELQRALLVAMTSELGWQANAKPSTAAGQAWQADQSPTARTNYAGVDFVDLRAGSNAVVAAAVPAPAEIEPSSPPEPVSMSEPESVTAPASATEPSVGLTASSNAVPGFIAGTNAVFAFDTSIAPAGTALSFWRTSANAQFQSLGGAILGTSPMAVFVPYSFSVSASANLTVMATLPNGTSNVLGHLWTPGTASP